MNTNLNFRNVKVLPEEIILWKRYFLQLIYNKFYQSQKQLKLDDNNKAKIAICFDWIVGNIDLTLNKGLLLRGEVGTGKSCILKACKTFIEKLYNGVYCRYITADEISRTFEEKTESSEKKLNHIFTEKILFIDDIGYEALKVFDHYPIAEVIRERYDKKRITCLTTNMTMEEIANRYGKSFEDKLNEMTFIVKFDGDSKR